jgi:hypothetical protein
MLQSALLSTALLTLVSAAGPKLGVAPAAMSGDATSHEAKFQDQLQQSLEASGFEVVRLEEGWAGDCDAGACMGPAMESAGVDYVAEQAVAATSGLEAPAGDPEPAPEGPEPEPAPAAMQSDGGVDRADRARYVGMGMTGGGAIMLISGIVMIAVEEKPYGPKCDDANTDANGECEFRNQTVEGGTVLTVLGGLTAGAGATLWYLHRKNKKGGQVALGPFGRGIKIGGSF